jgi:hypothetical protein
MWARHDEVEKGASVAGNDFRAPVASRSPVSANHDGILVPIAALEAIAARRDDLARTVARRAGSLLVDVTRAGYPLIYRTVVAVLARDEWLDHLEYSCGIRANALSRALAVAGRTCMPAAQFLTVRSS